MPRQRSNSNGISWKNLVIEKHGKNLVIESDGKVMENRQYNNVMDIENILKKSWNVSTAYHEQEVSIVP